MSFNDLGLQPWLTAKCGRLGFTEPTPVQKKAIPVILEGRDVIASAATGTGKTAAFMLPILQRLGAGHVSGTSVLVLAPTRELANQIEGVCRDFRPKGISSAVVIGGTGYGKQTEALERGVNVLIATPGRLIDFMDQGMVDFSRLTTLVLDEADRMLDMGFLPAIRRIVRALPKQRQSLFFSATMSGEMEQLAMEIVRDPEFIAVGSRGRAAETIEQFAYPVAQQHKMPLLLDLLSKEPIEKVLVFTRTKRGADRLASVLEKWDHRSHRIHGDRSQSQREAALRAFKHGKTNILVATDVAARGIDIDSVSHVINYDIPEVPEDYVHRIGRTGRAGNTGRAITLFTSAEESSIKAIERLIGQNVERVHLPQFGGTLVPAGSDRPAARSFRTFGRRSRRR